MPRNRTIYQSQALFAGPSPATGFHFYEGAVGSITGTKVNELLRIQSINHAYNIPLTPINQFNQLGNISLEQISEPTVSLDFSYLQASLYNERILGFVISSGTFVSAITGMIGKTEDERNYFIKTVAEGSDALGISAIANDVFGIGNGFITSYTAEGSVGNVPTCSVRVEAANLDFVSSTSGEIPALNPTNGAVITDVNYMLPASLTNPTGSLGTAITTTVLKPGDIVLDFGAYSGIGPAVSDVKAQSYNITVDMARDPLRKLGNKFPFSREIRFPIDVTMTITADYGDMNDERVVNLLTRANSFDVGVKTYAPDTTVANRNDANVASYILVKGAALESQNFTQSIGPNAQVTMTFRAQVGGPSQTTKGVFFSGAN